jgi:sialate O-acetylesterase
VQNVSETPRQALKGTWKPATAANVPSFSAVAYLFAKHLHRDKKVAVGIIHASWGGTPIESWMSAEMLLLHSRF